MIHGFEHIEHIGRLPTGAKDRPLSTVTIAHCGELELRRPPVKKARSVSPVSDRSASPRRKSKSKSRHASASDSDSDADSYQREKRRRKEKKKEKKEKRDKGKKPREETEEELDARLEREEKERLEVKRLEKLAEMKKQLEEERQRIKDAGGVVYKGESCVFATRFRTNIGANADTRPLGRPGIHALSRSRIDQSLHA